MSLGIREREFLNCFRVEIVQILLARLIRTTWQFCLLGNAAQAHCCNCFTAYIVILVAVFDTNSCLHSTNT